MEAYIIMIFIPSFYKTKEVNRSGVMRKTDFWFKLSKFPMSDPLFLYQKWMIEMCCQELYEGENTNQLFKFIIFLFHKLNLI